MWTELHCNLKATLSYVVCHMSYVMQFQESGILYQYIDLSPGRQHFHVKNEKER
jgi:hypothetical protein